MKDVKQLLDELNEFKTYALDLEELKEKNKIFCNSNAELKRQISNLNQDLMDTQEENDKLVKERDALQEENAELYDRIYIIKTESKAKSIKIADLSKENDRLVNELESYYEQVEWLQDELRKLRNFKKWVDELNKFHATRYIIQGGEENA